MIEVPLTPTRLNLVTQIDDADYFYVNQCSWRFHKPSKQRLGYAACFYSDYSSGHCVQRFLFLHRFILALNGVTIGDKLVVDHCDGNPLNNQKSNLRLVTQGENARNRIRHKNNRSGFRGVYHHSSGGKLKKAWRVEITVNGKRIQLGYFATPEEASHAYDEAARKHYGPYARLNFPQPGEQAA